MPRTRIAALLASICTSAVALAACSGGTGGTGDAGASTPPVSTASSSTSSTPAQPSPSVAATATPTAVAGTSVIAKDLDVPWGLVRLDDGSYLISLRDEARIVRVDRHGKATRISATGPDGRVPSVDPGGEGGLLGIAMAPGDPTRLYAYLTTSRDNRVVAMTYGDGRLGSLTALVTGIPKAGNHNGGRLAFGPDGYLYITTGDAGVTDRAQSRTSLGGKILRVTTSGAPAPGNPFPGSRIWSYGHRNVQGLGWDTAGRMYASEFGQNTWDELNRIEPGHNYGWPIVEGMDQAAKPGQTTSRGFTNPLVVWPTSQASPSGIAVGRGAVWLAALRGERLWRVPLSASGEVGEPVALLRNTFGRLRAVAFAPDGSLVVLTSNRFRGDPEPDDDRLIRVRLR